MSVGSIAFSLTIWGACFSGVPWAEPKDFKTELAAVDLTDDVNKLYTKIFLSLSCFCLTLSPHQVLPSEMTPQTVKNGKLIKL